MHNFDALRSVMLFAQHQQLVRQLPAFMTI
nr:MAG TPA: hypothetical protein [Bacteriophage sp.]